MSDASTIASRTFVAADQLTFAALSGDHNPLHVDTDAARRSMFGQPVVHGVNQMLWALDRFYATSPDAPPFADITARFLKPAFLGEALLLSVTHEGGTTQLLISIDSTVLTHVTLNGVTAASPEPDWQPAPSQRDATPKNRRIVELVGAVGTLPIDARGDNVESLFPAASDRLGLMKVATLLALTRLVGMECPGLHSIFSSLTLAGDSSASSRLDWRVAKASARLSIVNIDVNGGGLTGRLVCFVRPAPQESPGTTSLAERMRPGSCTGRRALIIGGSRGLGLICAKLLALGGADVVLSWHRGSAEAEAAVADISAAGGRARAVQLDTSAPALALTLLETAGFNPDELYYFATPHIFTRKKALFEPELFAAFADSYVSGLMRVVLALRQHPGLPLRIFLPSSEAIDEPLRDLFEYTVAKAAAEQVARLLPLFDPAITVVSRRLPRLPTDQTLTLIAVPSADPAVTMTEVIAAMAPAVVYANDTPQEIE